MVDDGSSDNTPEVLLDFKDDPRVTLIHQQNRGLAQALNRGFSETTGAYVGWTSADNRYLPDTLDRLGDFLTCNPQVGLVYANVTLIDESGAPLTNSSYRVEDQDPDNSALLRLPFAADTLHERNDNFINACVLFRNGLRDVVGEHYTELHGFEDYDYWLRLSLQARLAHLDSEDSCYEYRLHRSSLTTALKDSGLADSQEPFVRHTATAHRALSSKLNFTITKGNAVSQDCLELLESDLERAGYVARQKRHTMLSPNAGNALVIHAPEFSSGDAELQSCLSRASALHVECLEQYSQAFSCVSLSRHLQSPALISIRLCADQKRIATNFLQPILRLPPMKLPNVIRRARDCSFGAVTAGIHSEKTILFFSPDELPSAEYETVFSTISAVIAEQKQNTFVLYCENNAQRKTADRLNLSLGNSENLRIIDQSNLQGNTIALDESLMFVLSSVDLICSVKAAFPSATSVLEVRTEAALAALAGVPVVLMGCSAADSKLPPFISTYASTMPHLGYFMLSDGESSYSVLSDGRKRELASLFAEAGYDVSHNSLEQYLRTLNPGVLGRTIAALFFSSQPL